MVIYSNISSEQYQIVLKLNIVEYSILAMIQWAHASKDTLEQARLHLFSILYKDI